MTEYVLLYPRCFCWFFGHSGVTTPSPNVLLVLKNKPTWQNGRLNLIGGKIEPGESPEDAAKRELKEESGFCLDHEMIDSISEPVICGKILGVDSIIHCLTFDIYSVSNSLPNVLPRSEETEQVSWNKWEVIKNDPRLIPNLQIIIPLLANDLRSWTVIDQNSSLNNNVHSISIQLGISQPFVNSNNI